MKTLRSHVCGHWHEATTGFTELHDPCSEQVVARASSAGIDFRAVLTHARSAGGPALRQMSFAQRGELLQAMSKALHAERDALIELSLQTTGTTRKDAKFDLDGATATLAFYANLGKELGERRVLADGDGVALGRSERFYGRHVRLPLLGAAIQINAFNFPAWGFAEKAACSLLAGVPSISKPASSTAMVTARCVEILVEANLLPDGALQFICGEAGDLLSHLGPQDALAFTGSAVTALKLRRAENLLAASTRVNIEADSLNAAVLGPDVAVGSDTWNLFLKDVEREITQKTGQKCTAVRRVFVPASMLDTVLSELADRLGRVITGNPADPSVTMGPLTSARQLEDALAGITTLQAQARLVLGSGHRVDGVGNPAGQGFFLAPTLLHAPDARAATAVHDHEVFGPVATVMTHDDSAEDAASLVALAQGTLVTSVYSDDDGWVSRFVDAAGAWTGRLYFGSAKMAEQAMGSGLVLPQSVHGGPGRAGGGEELGGLRGLEFYTRRVALQGSRKMVESLAGER